MRHRLALLVIAVAALPAVAQDLAPPVVPGSAPAAHNPALQFLIIDNPVGTLLIWSCMIISVAVISLIIQNALQSRPGLFSPADLRQSLGNLMAQHSYREAIALTDNDPSPLAQVMRAALAEAPRGYQAMEIAIEDAADNVGNRRVRDLIWLEIAGAAGPMIGLFGTVFGMILAFGRLQATAGAPKPAELAGGIGTALVCTFWGLVVGIPGVIAASFFRVRIESLTADLIAQAKNLIADFRPAPKKAG